MGRKKLGQHEPCQRGHTEGRNSQNRCLVCFRAAQKVWSAANRDKERVRAARFRQENPEYGKSWWKQNSDKARKYLDRRASKYHGLTRVQVLERLAAQGGRCAVCLTTDPGRYGWPMDHDHKTGRLRSVLCHSCNVAIGNMGDDPARLRAAAAYLERSQQLQELF